MLAFALRLLQGLLALGIIALCAWGAVSLGRSQEHSSADAGAAGIEGGPAAREDLPRYAVIGERDLFRMKVEKVEPPPPPVIEESTLHVELLGTLVRGGDGPPEMEVEQGANGSPSKTAAPRPESLAILRDVDGEVRTLAKGDVFADERAKLVEIERGRIVLEQSGRLETVTLEQGPLAAKSGAARPAYRAPQNPAEAAAAAKAEQIARMQREVQRRMREAMPQAGAVQPVTTGRN